MKPHSRLSGVRAILKPCSSEVKVSAISYFRLKCSAEPFQLFARRDQRKKIRNPNFETIGTRANPKFEALKKPRGPKQIGAKTNSKSGKFQTPNPILPVWSILVVFHYFEFVSDLPVFSPNF
jgi:hypothetical protein